MPSKSVTVPEIGAIQLIKRKGSRSIRLSVTPQGQVRVSLPTWVPYQAAVNFAHTKADWIIKQRAATSPGLLLSGQAIGKAHHLYLQRSFDATAPSTRLQGGSAKVIYPASLSANSPIVQQAARSVSIRALRSEAERLIPQRLHTLAARGGFTYRNIQIKQLKRRWGSCNQKGEIVINLFLMQLPWELIDYVIWHELAHTKHLHHGTEFWGELQTHVPDAKVLRKRIRTYTTDVLTDGGDNPLRADGTFA